MNDNDDVCKRLYYCCFVTGIVTLGIILINVIKYLHDYSII